MARHTGTTCTYSSAMTNYGCTKALDGSLAYQDEWIALDSDGSIVWITVGTTLYTFPIDKCRVSSWNCIFIFVIMIW